MCGLFGYTGIEKPDAGKLKILGITNTSRGVDSCGYYTNSEKQHIVKGVDKEANFIDFVAKNDLIIEDDTTIFIGHTRKSTMGANTKDNAHPFSINNDELIGAHNGVIKNHVKLANNFKLKEYYNVDSKTLLTCVNNDMLRALKLYDGHAALLFVKNNKLHVYKGASLQTSASYYDNVKQMWTKNEQAFADERPLFALKTKTGFYFSSILNSLKIIKEKDDEILEIESNSVHVFEKNKLLEKIKVVRKPLTEYDEVGKKWFGSTNTNSSVGNTKPVVYSNQVVDFKPKSKNAVYYSKFRYFQKNKLLEGAVRINPTGFINSKYSVTYYFFKGILLNDIISDEEYQNALNELTKLYNTVESVVKNSKGKISLSHSCLSSLVKELRLYTDVPIYFEEFQATINCSLASYQNKINYFYASLFNNCRMYHFTNYGALVSSTEISCFKQDINTLIYYGEDYWKNIYFNEKLQEDKNLSTMIITVIKEVANHFGFDNKTKEKNLTEEEVEIGKSAAEFIIRFLDASSNLYIVKEEFEEFINDVSVVNQKKANKITELFENVLDCTDFIDDAIGTLTADCYLPDNYEIVDQNELELLYETM